MVTNEFFGKNIWGNGFWTFFLSIFKTEKNFPNQNFFKKYNKLNFLLKEVVADCCCKNPHQWAFYLDI